MSHDIEPKNYNFGHLVTISFSYHNRNIRTTGSLINRYSNWNKFLIMLILSIVKHVLVHSIAKVAVLKQMTVHSLIVIPSHFLQLLLDMFVQKNNWNPLFQEAKCDPEVEATWQL